MVVVELVEQAQLVHQLAVLVELQTQTSNKPRVINRVPQAVLTGLVLELVMVKVQFLNLVVNY